MSRALAALALLALPAFASDAATLCGQLGSESAKERAEAVEALRKAGPEADAALEAATGAGGNLARAVREARRWDPEARVPEVEPFGELASPEAARRLAGFARLVGFGSSIAAPAVRRILDASAAPDRANFVRTLGSGAGHDRGWAREAIRFLRNPARELRSAAATALAMHAGREQVGDLRLALEHETEIAIRFQLWQSLIWTSGAPEELPSLPVDPEEYSTVLGWLAEGPSAELRSEAWRALERRRPAVIPQAFWNDPSRLLGLMGTASYLAELPADAQPRLMPLEVRALLSISPRAEARSTAAVNDELSPTEVARVAVFLSDPDLGVRRGALGALERWERANDRRSESERSAALSRVGAALRTLLESAAGAGDPREVDWALRTLLDAGRVSSASATLAYQAFWISDERARDGLLALEADKDLGGAAKRARRLLAFRLSPQEVGFQRGFDGMPRVRSSWQTGIDLEAWRGLAKSEDAEEKQLAVSLMGNAWDRLDHRGDVAAEIQRLAQEAASGTTQAALGFLASQAPDRLPDREDLDPRDTWSRARSYVLPRLRATLGPANVLDRQKTSLIQSYGDRSLLLAAVRAGRFDQPSTEWILTMPGGEEGLLPILMARLMDLEAPLGVPWFGALASCSPQGAQVVAAIAREADAKSRPSALAALLSRPWADDLSGPIAEALAATGAPGDRKILLEALKTSPVRNRWPCSSRLADAIASLLLQLSADSASRADLEALVSTIGESLSRASAESLAALAKDTAISSLARNYGIDFSPAGSPEQQILAGDRNTRYRAMNRLPPRSLKSIRLTTISWLTCGSLGDASEIWTLQRSGDVADLVLLSFAAEDPDACDEILRLRRLVRRWYSYSPASAPASWRLLEVSPASEFDGNSAQLRTRAASPAMSREPSPEFFALCAAAFRGATGDEIALQAILPRLGPDALPRLVPLLEAPAPAIRQAAADAVGRLGDAAPRFAAAALRLSLDGESNLAARSAKLGALARLKDAKGLEELRAMASSPEADDRLAAAHALEQAPGAETAAILASLADDTDFPVREAAHAALQRMTRREYPPDVAPWATRDWANWLHAHPGIDFGTDDNN